MTEKRRDHLTSAAISLRVGGKPSFLLLITKEGTVRRMGYSAVDNAEKTVAVVEDASVFERFLEGLPTDVLDHAGSHEAEDLEGERVVCRIELGSGSDTTTYEMTYSSQSAGLSRHMQLMVSLGEELTDDWYAANLTLTPVLDLPPVQKSPPTAPAAPPPAAYESPPVPEPPPPSVYEPSAAEEPEREQDVEEEAEPEEATSTTAAHPDAQFRPGGRPKAAKPRFALAVLLDLFVFTSAYGILILMIGAGPPIGLALFFLVLTEFCLLQFLTLTPGYWLLGMRADVGAFPTVDPDQLAGESLVTLIAATLLLSLGVESLTIWTHYQEPVPYFGFGWGTWFAVILSSLIGVSFIASAVLIFRNDVRGVWIGGGITAFSFLSVWFARGNQLNGWLRLELMWQREAQGRPVLDPLDLDPVLGAVVPTVCAVALGYGVGLYFVWKRFTRPQGAPPVAGNAQTH